MWTAKARRAVQFVLCIVAVLSGSLSARTAGAQSVAPSLYVGLGTGTNLGGTLGLGVELPVARHVAASAAIGIWPEALEERIFAGRAFDFDVGLKVYPLNRWFFTGLNYGIIHAEIRDSDGIPKLQKRRGLTFSLGLRTRVFHKFYVSSFAGVTSDGEANHFTVFDRRTFMPHMGLMIGYELSTRR